MRRNGELPTGMRLPLLLLLACWCLLAPGLAAGEEASPPPWGEHLSVLLVTAHPDDDALFGGAVYKITHSLGGTVDLLLLTNGEGGYKYSTLGEPIYGLELTREEVGRAWLPAIRKQELLAGGAIVGIRNYFFLDQKDGGYTRDMEEILAGGWDMDLVRKRFREVIAGPDVGGERYDFVFVMMPVLQTHAHHRASAIFALETVAAMPEEARPVILGGMPRWTSPERVAAAAELPPFHGLEAYPATRIAEGAPTYLFDRTQKFGLNDQLDYNIIVNWVIAEHKSQGTMQLLMNVSDGEIYHSFAVNTPGGEEVARKLFEQLAAAPVHGALEHGGL